MILKKLAFCASLVLTAPILAQTGRISGTIVDSKTGETLPGALVVIEGTSKAATADFDGKFALNNVPAGKVTLIVNYISYVTKRVGGIEVRENDVSDVNVPLETSGSQELQEVAVVAKVSRENNVALLLQQKNNASVSDGISAESIRRTPDRNTSDVLRRVSGASIQDNKFVIVRGLSERYNTAYLNGAPLPSSESDRKAFSFDVFPSNVIDQIVITKTARPDMPGEFGGGIIDITTKNIPEKNFLSVSAGTGYNTVTTGAERKYYKGGKTDWLGVDDGGRAMPANIPSYRDFPVDVHEQADLAKKTPTTDWGIYTKRFAPNTSFQAMGGWNIKRKDNDFVGLIASLSYNNNFNLFTTERKSYTGQPQDPGNPLQLERDYTDKTYQTQKLVGALLNASVKLNENNSISLKNLYSIFTDDRLIERSGDATPLESNPLLVKSSAFWFTQNNALTSQLIGDHYIPKARIRIQWNSNAASVTRTIPNLRRHNYTRLTYLTDRNSDPSEPPLFDPRDTLWRASFGTSNASGNEYAGIMMFSELNETIFSQKLDLGHTLKMSEDITLESKTGGLYQVRDRVFDFRQFIYSEYGSPGSSTTFSTGLAFLPPDQLFTAQNMGVISKENGSSVGGFKLSDATLPQSGYTAGSSLAAAYVMADIRYRNSVRLVTGIRYESYLQRISYNDNLFIINGKVISKDTTVNDLLPSLNLILSPTEKMNIRASYAKTLNRPEFRELAPFLFYDFNTQFSLNGNDTLQRSLIHNYDLRWEAFPTAGQLISVSGFYKRFVNPIEIAKAQNPTALVYKNVPGAFCAGVEFEFRINVGRLFRADSSFTGKILENLTLFSNLALIRSRIERGNTDAIYDRPMQGQSPYVINGGLSYIDQKKHFSISAMINRVGERIYVVGNDLNPEIWEMPRTALDLQLTKALLNNRLELRLNIKDLLARSQPLRYLNNYAAAVIDENSPYTAPFWRNRFGSVYSFIISWKIR